MPANAGTIAHNVWFNGAGSTSFDTAAVSGDPLFVAAAGVDFHLQAASPAIGVGSSASAVSALVADDYNFKPRGANRDLGALGR